MNKILFHSTETKTLTKKKTEVKTNVYKSELVQCAPTEIMSEVNITKRSKIVPVARFE